MNIIVMTGKLKDDIELKDSGIAVGTIISEGSYFDIVAFKDKATELAYFTKDQLVMVQGELQKKKYKDKYYYKIVVRDIQRFEQTEKPSEILDNSEIIEDNQEITGANLDSLVLDDDDTPF